MEDVATSDQIWLSYSEIYYLEVIGFKTIAWFFNTKVIGLDISVEYSSIMQRLNSFYHILPNLAYGFNAEI